MHAVWVRWVGSREGARKCLEPCLHVRAPCWLSLPPHHARPSQCSAALQALTEPWQPRAHSSAMLRCAWPYYLG